MNYYKLLAKMSVCTGIAMMGLGAVNAAPSFGADLSESLNHQALKELLLRCVLQPYTTNPNGVKTLYPTRSTCSDDLVIREQTATFILDGEKFTATITDAADSDGGDLDDLVIKNARGAHVFELHNVLAFNDIAVALAEGQVSFNQVEAN